MIQMLLMLIHAIILARGLLMVINADSNMSLFLGLLIVIINLIGIIINVVGILR